MMSTRRPSRWRSTLAAAIVVASAAGACAGRGARVIDGPMSRESAAARARAIRAVGRQIFADPSLSRSGTLACATCHEPAHAFGPSWPLEHPPAGAAVPERAVPSLMYLQATPAFTEHFFENEGDESLDNGPTGGLTWDGRIDRGRDQARIPLFSPIEMANESVEAFAARVRRTPYAGALQDLFGFRPADASQILDAVDAALEAYEQSEADFYPYSSRYDAYLRGTTALSAQEMRGLSVFEAATKGNCAKCHPSQLGPDGTLPQFTDYGYAALAVPRNRSLPSTQDRSHYDLGLCGPRRTDLADRRRYCGQFKTPSLRNVAMRPYFFHNGGIRTLRDAVAFYADRDRHPQRWYAAVDGVVQPFDDLPGEYVGNVEKQAPFGGREDASAPLTDQDVDDIVAFLHTLTDARYHTK